MLGRLQKTKTKADPPGRSESGVDGVDEHLPLQDLGTQVAAIARGPAFSEAERALAEMGFPSASEACRGSERSSFPQLAGGLGGRRPPRKFLILRIKSERFRLSGLLVYWSVLYIAMSNRPSFW